VPFRSDFWSEPARSRRISLLVSLSLLGPPISRLACWLLRFKRSAGSFRELCVPVVWTGKPGIFAAGFRSGHLFTLRNEGEARHLRRRHLAVAFLADVTSRT